MKKHNNETSALKRALAENGNLGLSLSVKLTLTLNLLKGLNKTLYDETSLRDCCNQLDVYGSLVTNKILGVSSVFLLIAC